MIPWRLCVERDRERGRETQYQFPILSETGTERRLSHTASWCGLSRGGHYRGSSARVASLGPSLLKEALKGDNPYLLTPAVLPVLPQIQD